jgi:hypothetical protein
VVSAGDLLCVVIEWVTWAAGNDVDVQVVQSLQGGDFAHGSHYAQQYTASWQNPESGKVGMMALKYNDGSYGALGPAMAPMGGASNLSFSSASSPDERGLKFRFPFPVTCSGAFAMVDADGDFDIVLYDSNGTSVLASQSFDKDVRGDASFGSAVARWDGQSLLKDTFYRVAIKPTTTTNIRVNPTLVQAPSAAALEAMDGGADIHYTHRVNAGAWTDVTDDRAPLGVHLTAFDDGAGGAGGGGIKLAGPGGGLAG